MAIPLICDLKIQEELMFCCSYVLSCPSGTDLIRPFAQTTIKYKGRIFSEDISHVFTNTELFAVQSTTTTPLPPPRMTTLVRC